MTLGLVGFGLAVTAPAAHAAGGSYAVTSTGDQADLHPGDHTCLSTGGLCTLRAAMTEANADGGTSSITFAIPGTGVHTISVTNALPGLTDTAGGTTIDGYTQSGSAPNTDPLVDNAALRIEVRGPGSTGPDAFFINSPNNVIRGLSIYAFRSAVHMVFGGDHNAVVGNFIGTNAAGTYKNTVLNTNSFGVAIDQLASYNVVGRPTNADRNLISGNSGRGVFLRDAVLDTKIQNNVVGLSPNGTARLPNADHGIDVNNGSTRTVIGGGGAHDGNVVSGNDGHGIEVSHSPDAPALDTMIIQNRIGTDPSGNSGPAYARNGDRYSHENVHVEEYVKRTTIAFNIIGNSTLGGIKIDAHAVDTLIAYNRIGLSANGAAIPNGPYGVQIEEGSTGTVVGPGNEITHNRSGIRLQGDDTVHNRITGNSIYGNDRLGIDIAPLDVVNTASVMTATNGGMHFPVLTAATNTSVSGQTCASCRVEVFRADSTSTDPGLEASYGEGRTLLGLGTADSGGHFKVSIPSSSGARAVTATATDSANNTSEFSRNLIAPK